MDRMPRERKAFQVWSICAVYALPSSSIRMRALQRLRDVWSLLTPTIQGWLLAEPLLGVLQFVVSLAHTPTNGERVALPQLMHARKESGHPQALQPLFCKLDQGLGPVTDEVASPCPESGKPLIHPGLPRRLGALLGHAFQQQIPRCAAP
jgi:hypothetical protein